MKREDRIRLQHMLDAATDALSFAHGRERKDLDSDRQLVLAIVKSVEIIGEAAAGIDPYVRLQIPELPWDDIIAMRHRLVHAYYDVNLDIVWRTVQNDLPPLVDVLQGVLGDTSA